VLGLILTGAALEGANVQTSLLLVAYAAGAATSLALALIIGGRVFTVMKRSLGAGEWVRRGLGVAVLAGVVVIALGLDTRFLTQVSLASTAPLEQGLVDKLHSVASDQRPMGGRPLAMTGNSPVTTENRPEAQAQPLESGGPVAMTGNPPPAMQPEQPKTEIEDFAYEGAMPSLSGAVLWLNSPPLSPQELRGKVVVVDFWTYSCINCLRSLPYVRAWSEKYKGQGLVVIGVHTPEFAFEKNTDNVKKAVADLKIDFPVAIDNDYAIWRAFKNHYWPADYFIDAQGRIRDHAFGEGDYAASEHVIQQLLARAGGTGISGGLVAVNARGPKRHRTPTAFDHPRPISATPARRNSSHRVGSSKAARMFMTSGNCNSTNGVCLEIGPSAENTPSSIRKRAASPTGSTRAISTSFSVRRAMAIPFASASRLTARRPVTTTAPMSMPTARVS